MLKIYTIGFMFLLVSTSIHAQISKFIECEIEHLVDTVILGNYIDSTTITKITSKSEVKTEVQTIAKTEVSKTINCTSGELTNLLTDDEKATVTNLTITGTIDASDFKTLRDSIPLLAILDINAATISEYTGTNGTASYIYEYPANAIPQYAFFNEQTGLSKTNLTSIIFPSNLTVINGAAFYKCNGLIGELSFPPSLLFIDTLAFARCTGLSGDLNLPSNLTIIGRQSFYGCTGLDGELNLPNSLISIEGAAFYGCNKLIGNLSIPTNTNKIGKSAFFGCSGFNGTLTLPESLSKIDSAAFQGCSSLIGSLIIPESVDTIYWQTFSNCSGLNGNLTLGESTKYIGQAAFYGCSHLIGNLVIPSSVETIKKLAFYNCSGFTGALTIPNSVTLIGHSTFANCIGFTGSLVIPNSVLTIEYDAFMNDSSFNGSLVLGNSLHNIGSGAFYNCSGFTGSLTIPNSVASIGGFAFYNCNGFNETLTFGINLQNIGNKAFANCTGFTGGLVIPNLTTIIGAYAFQNDSSFNGSLILGNSLQNIGDWAFYNCYSFTGGLTIPNSVTSIGDWAFDNCSGFTGALTFPNSVTSIGGSAFANCSGFTGSLTFPNSVTSIGGGAFMNCSGFTGSLTFPNSVTSIGGGAFWYCSGFNSLELPSNISEIKVFTFAYCSGLTNTIEIPSSVSSIGYFAFDKCYKLGGVILPSSLLQIGEGAFRDCENLKGNLIIPSSVTNIDEDAFRFTTGLDTITILSSNVLIDRKAFLGTSGNFVVGNENQNFSSIDGVLFNKPQTELIQCPVSKQGNYEIPSTVTTLNNLSFYGCNNLNILKIPTSITSIGYGAFAFCTKLNSIYSNSFYPVDIRESVNVFYDVDTTNCTLYVPQGSLSSYKSASQWQAFNHIIEGVGLWLSDSGVNFNSSNASSTFIAINTNTLWNANSNQSWLTVSPTSGNGYDTLTISATENPTFEERTAIVTVSATGATSQTITVTQAAKGAVLLVSSNSLSIGKAAGSSASVDVTCSTTWAASSNQSWLTLSDFSGTGNSKLVFTAQKNQTIETREATVTISAPGVSNQIVEVTQAAGDTVLLVSSNLLSIGKDEGSTSSVNVTSNTTWSASSNQAWLTLGNSNDTGNSKLVFTAQKNPTIETREATVTISATGVSNQIVEVTQAAGDTVLLVSSNSLSIGKDEGSDTSFNIISNTSWTANSDQEWLSLDVALGTGDTTITLTAEKNPTAAPRAASITISAIGADDQIVNVTQEAGDAVGVDFSKAGNVLIVPNPNNGTFYIKSKDNINGNVVCQIVDVQGVVIEQFNWGVQGNLNQNIILNNLSAGIYHIRLCVENEIQVLKLVVY